ncbi:MAG: D-Ala-D-Ala carboxypeptidase family metallohydrolase [Calditrichia bacterium]
MGNLGKYFNRSEVACKCGCGLLNIDPRLLEILDKIRDILGRPLIITSACRCPIHNHVEGGKENSAHLKGLAADLKVNGSKERFEVMEATLVAGMTRIGIAKTFIHIDIDSSKPQRVAWLY